MTEKIVHLWNTTDLPEPHILLLVSSHDKPVREIGRFPVSGMGAQLICVSLEHMAGLMAFDRIDVDLCDVSAMTLLRSARLFKDSPTLAQLVRFLEAAGLDPDGPDAPGAVA